MNPRAVQFIIYNGSKVIFRFLVQFKLVEAPAVMRLK